MKNIIWISGLQIDKVCWHLSQGVLRLRLLLPSNIFFQEQLSPFFLQTVRFYWQKKQRDSTMERSEDGFYQGFPSLYNDFSKEVKTEKHHKTFKKYLNYQHFCSGVALSFIFNCLWIMLKYHSVGWKILIYSIPLLNPPNFLLSIANCWWKKQITVLQVEGKWKRWWDLAKKLRTS